ncbi:MAG: hypothetical protein LBO74_01390 [Candidatus Symbiothrix sp.]|jgi:hypothetical protein|nr:hypothetical protein [Candidatus Symbiothrix sp.]
MAITFIAKRISRNDNLLFPDKLIIDGAKIIIKRGPFSKWIFDKSNIASVMLDEYLLFYADVVIESVGGGKMVAKGFSKVDTREIINLLT